MRTCDDIMIKKKGSRQFTLRRPTNSWPLEKPKTGPKCRQSRTATQAHRALQAEPRYRTTNVCPAYDLPDRRGSTQSSEASGTKGKLAERRGYGHYARRGWWTMIRASSMIGEEQRIVRRLVGRFTEEREVLCFWSSRFSLFFVIAYIACMRLCGFRLCESGASYLFIEPLSAAEHFRFSPHGPRPKIVSVFAHGPPFLTEQTYATGKHRHNQEIIQRPEPINS